MKTCSGYWPDRGTPCLRMLRNGVCPKGAEVDHGYYSGGPPDDPRWDWVDISTMSQPNQWIKGACRHLTPEPVETTDPVSGDVLLVAKICPDCDTTLWRWGDDDLADPNGFERWAYAPSAGLVLPEVTKDEESAFTEAFRQRMKDPYSHLIFVGGGVVNKNRRPWPDRVWSRFVSVWEWIKDHHWIVWLWVGSVLVVAATTGHLEGWK